MNLKTDRKTMAGISNLQKSDEKAAQVPMHPDDFEAHLAWITAKRLHELVLKETFAEKPVYYRLVG